MNSNNNEYLISRGDLITFLRLWPFYLTSIILAITFSFLLTRYSSQTYLSEATIEILDKSQDSEMALPTAMTIFNRSLINLENEIGVLKSFSLNRSVVYKNDLNIEFLTKGTIRSVNNTKDDWLNSNYDLKFNFDTDTISKTLKYLIKKSGQNLKIDKYLDDEFLFSKTFFNNTTAASNYDFDLTIDKKNELNYEKLIIIYPIDVYVSSILKRLEIKPAGRDSDHLVISLSGTNPKNSELFLNLLINEFDYDGVLDRQLEYKRTIQFVEKRSEILADQLEEVELRKQKYKSVNEIANIQYDASQNIEQKLVYDKELFEVESQKSIAILLKDLFSEKNYNLLPANIGLENANVNNLVNEYNNTVRERDRFLISAGENNKYIKDLNSQLDIIQNNIIASIENLVNGLNIKIESINLKEKEFEKIYAGIPESEKILRSINRELEIKEALFLLLLQKKEEASINFAVVKPSIKIVDLARTDLSKAYPNTFRVYALSIIISLILCFLSIYALLIFDDKIHLESDIRDALNDLNISFMGYIPFLNEPNKLLDKYSRDSSSEAFRMIVSNLNFKISELKLKNSNCPVILLTSSIKSEGKTLCAVNFAHQLDSKNKKVILVGCDLRNPQVHKFFGLSKNLTGLSDVVMNKKINWSDCIHSIDDSIDILFSGTIPFDTNSVISSSRFSSILDEIKAEYDYVVIDSAPTMIVSDTFYLSKHVDFTLYVIRANHTPKELINFIAELKSNNKLPEIGIILNSVGRRSIYGYGYNYSYAYNYGYGYKYSTEKN